MAQTKLTTILFVFLGLALSAGSLYAQAVEERQVYGDSTLKNTITPQTRAIYDQGGAWVFVLTRNNPLRLDGAYGTALRASPSDGPCPAFTEDDEALVRRAIRAFDDGVVAKATAKKLKDALKTEIDSLRVLALVRKHVSPKILEDDRSQERQADRKEVVLSEYFAPPTP